MGDATAVRALLRAGADPTVKERLYGGTPGDWAANFGHTTAAELIATAPRPGART